MQRRLGRYRSAGLRPAARQLTVSNFILDNPEQWLQRAEEARSIAEELSDPESRRMILRIAEDYERLTTPASRRKKGRMAQAETHTAAFQALAGFGGAVRSLR